MQSSPITYFEQLIDILTWASHGACRLRDLVQAVIK